MKESEYNAVRFSPPTLFGLLPITKTNHEKETFKGYEYLIKNRKVTTNRNKNEEWPVKLTPELL